MFVQTPDGGFPVASLDSPELAAIEDPTPGTWNFFIRDFSTVRGSERYTLEIAEIAGTAAQRGSQVETARPRLVAVTPNPAVSGTDVHFALPKGSRARVDVYDVAGRHVDSLLDDALAAGAHDVRWSGRTAAGAPAADGVYFLRLTTDAGTSTRKVVLRR
jgi:hypothetical protein